MKQWMSVLGVVFLASTGSVLAHEMEQAGVTVDHPWARPTPAVAPVHGAVYFSVTNRREVPVVLDGASTPLTDHASIHQTRDVDGTLRMESVEGGLAIQPGESISFEPGGYHVMLMNMEAPLTEGEKFPLTLTFQGGESILLDVWVEQGPETQSDMTMHHH
ncbi:copper chaperone PCu(A)C [Marinobacter zhejiangensis]|uniref:Copper(I)-binding protein n=1 Tax=Marinobacter zhejiangensis TaxID=488535 RepID=A0A1I4MHP5_9GAMM|nr:copper chaperone PCu(A)C [Marinobacter zhejiangensis]SFM02605.1 hypothetical protein SAMN04487963_1088 [Marinobacter zhejiangensis]